MKKGIVSIIISVLGLYFVYNFNTILYSNTQPLPQTEQKNELLIDLFATGRLPSMLAMSIGLLSMYIGITAFKHHKQIARIAILLSFILCTLSWIPFWKILNT